MAVTSRPLRVPPDPGGPKLVELRGVVTAIVVTALLTMVASVMFSIILIGQPEDGAQGPPGPVGQRGPPGIPPKVDRSTVWKALAADPQRLAKLVQKNLTVAAPTDQSQLVQVQDEVAALAGDLRALCSQLQSSSALSEAGLSCP